MTSITYSAWIYRCFDGDDCLLDDFEYRSYVTIKEATEYFLNNGFYDEETTNQPEVIRMGRDLIEETPAYRLIAKVVDKETHRQCKEMGYVQSLGYCHIFWEVKARILKEYYNINWKSPAEMNPEILYD